MINFKQAIFERLILHSIDKKLKDHEFSVYTTEDELTVLEHAGIEILADRLEDALGVESKSFKLEIEIHQENSFFELATSCFGAADDIFISNSKLICRKLAEAQKYPRIPGGYLLVAQGYEGDQQFFLVIKAELHEAFRKEVDQITGRHVLSLIDNIFLSPAMRLFKIGLIYSETNPGASYPNDNYSCQIFDHQFIPTNAKPAAYFYNTFLGFDLNNNDKILTKRFYDGVESFIRELPDTEYLRQSELENILRTYLKNDLTGVVDPQQFGLTYLEEEERDFYSDRVVADYDTPFTKNLALVTFALKNKKLVFPEDVKIIGPEQVFDQRIHIISTQDELDNITLGRGFTMIRIQGRPYDV